MSHLNVTQQDADKAQSARVDSETIFEGDARVGALESDPLAVLGLLKAVPPPVGPAQATSQILDLAETVALAVVRAMRAHPVALAQYTFATVPSAASHTAAIIYVSNGAAGFPVVAFSNGVSWLRCDTLGVISP